MISAFFGSDIAMQPHDWDGGRGSVRAWGGNASSSTRTTTFSALIETSTRALMPTRAGSSASRDTHAAPNVTNGPLGMRTLSQVNPNRLAAPRWHHSLSGRSHQTYIRRWISPCHGHVLFFLDYAVLDVVPSLYDDGSHSLSLFFLLFYIALCNSHSFFN